MPETGEITFIHRGKECDAEWKMDFTSLSKEDGACYRSSEFPFEGESWYFMMLPNGCEFSDSDRHIHLCLFRISSNGPPITVEFTFAIKAANGHKVLQTERTEDIKGFGYHYIKRFVSTPDFLKRQSQFLVSGSLTLVCTLKRITSTGSLKCSYCKKNVDAKNIAMHEKKCMDRPIKCPECSEVISLENWYDHQCQTTAAEDEILVCEDLKEMLLNGLNHDLILRVGDKELKAHQDILRTRSPVFKSMLSHDMKEKNSGIIDIPDCDPQAMEQFLCYIYTGKVDSLDQSNMFKLYYIADKYDMDGLKRKCCAFMKKSLSNTNICEVIQLALNHSDSTLLEHATEYFKDNTLDIMCTVEWQTFLKDNSTAANELMMKSIHKLKNAST